MSDAEAIATAALAAAVPATTEGYASWHDEVWDKVAGMAGFELVAMDPIAPDAVSCRLKLPSEALSCCKIVALTEGGNGEFFVTLKKPEAQA